MFLETQQNTAKDLTPMPDQFEHYITQNIKAFYKRRLLTPIPVSYTHLTLPTN